MELVFALILTVITNIWFKKPQICSFDQGFPLLWGAVFPCVLQMQNVCLWLMSNFFSNSLYLKWDPNQSRKTKFKHWSETKQESNCITVAFQDALIILFQCILFYSYFNIALNFLYTELLGLLETSVWVWRGALFFPVAIWRTVISSHILKVETPLLGAFPGTHDLPYGRVSRWSPCCSWISGYQYKELSTSFPVQECQQKKWPARLPLFLSIAHVCSELWLTSACGCSQIQALIRLAIARAELLGNL